MSKKQPEPAVAALFFALGDPTRLALVSRLRTGARTATVLSEDSAVTRQAILKHLQLMESAGLVTHKKRGREVLYSLRPHGLRNAQTFLQQISEGWDRAIDRLRLMVEDEPPPKPRRPRHKRPHP